MASGEDSSIIVRVFKYSGKEYRRWKARIAKADDSLIVLDAEFGFAVKHEVLGEIPRGTRTAEYYWFNRWYNIFRFLKNDGSTRLWYCNINTPPILEHGVLSYIDLDIDVLVQPDFTYQVLDVDEFEQNALVFGYPDEVRRNVQRAISEVTSLIEARQFPFTENRTGRRRTNELVMTLAVSSINLADTLAVLRRNIMVHLRLWRLNLVAPVIEPVISVLGFGWGIGALVAGQVTGVSYLTFAGAGILGITVLMRAMFETTYAAYFRMVYQSTYDAILATPVDAESLAFAEILWAVTHAFFDTLIILVVLAIFGGATSWWALLAPVPLLLGALFMAGLSLGVTAHVRDIDAFNIYMAIFFSFMYVSGAWYPIEVLPVWLQIPAWAMPLTESIDLTRAFLTGHFLKRHVYEAIYLVISAVVACEWAMRSLRKRMVA